MKIAVTLALFLCSIAVHASPSASPLDSEFSASDDSKSNFPEPEVDENGIPIGMALVDGDILIPKEQLPIYEKEGFDGLVNSEAWLNGPAWPSKTVYYATTIPSNTPQLADLNRKIFDSMNDLNQKQNCLKFVYITAPIPQRHIVFNLGQGCYTMIGPVTPGNRHDIFLSPGCTFERIPAHEVMHALGRFHEQTRPDRDYYVQINWHLIKQDCISQYMRQDGASTLGLPYDYYSVMHYSPTSCSINGAPVMQFPPHVNPYNIGRGLSLTNTDIAHIVRRYCPSG
ncbi:PREDICTED: astacin-like metalloendopeptidase [Amphimedon queenslandica]|uniref:Metalloendopeptidase n=1 Tax=Amphimedon queenslandica TaxID=400682 RepID=A0A1X7V396_AMPQE|nr:PREDICTED: astacin-like metalloendopeptidase [Amphimedon queenslandica]|eukprot:XP_011403376.1 PREDICTED: astacin-like metalloendopeptidase [Amphimedon queenslandica]